MRSRSHHRIRSGFTLLLNQPITRSSFPMMAAAPGTSAIRVSGWSGGPFTSPNLIVDPKNPDRLFKTDGSMIVSEDAGKSLPRLVDLVGCMGTFIVVWIDPTNPQTVFAGDDGGMWYSCNSGSKWWKGRKPSRLASSTMSALTTRIRIASMADCRTTAAW